VLSVRAHERSKAHRAMSESVISQRTRAKRRRALVAIDDTSLSWSIRAADVA